MHAILRICLGDHNQSETNNARTVTDRTTRALKRMGGETSACLLCDA